MALDMGARAKFNGSYKTPRRYSVAVGNMASPIQVRQNARGAEPAERRPVHHRGGAAAAMKKEDDAAAFEHYWRAASTSYLLKGGFAPMVRAFTAIQSEWS